VKLLSFDNSVTTVRDPVSDSHLKLLSLWVSAT
jgi:hypothetical protein